MQKLTGEAWITSKAKRRQDIGLSLAMAPIAIPGVAAASTAIRFVDGMPPLFVHERLGQAHEAFRMYKLRTMPPETPLTAGGKHDDSRRTTLGKALARIRADEAPQFLNVLRGQMSIVGYRPLIAGEYEQAKQERWLTDKQHEDLMHMRAIGKPGLLHLLGVQNRDMEFQDMRECWQARYETEREYFDKASSEFDWSIMISCAKIAADILMEKASLRDFA
jgi:lipopolysaccharide/colanic/teichoic acid biosynthesis glycosyltransferase